MSHPPTIIVVHPKERRSKCSVEPLRGCPGIVFWTYPRFGPEPLKNYVRLGLGGPLLGPEDSKKGLLVLDGTWRHVQTMEKDFEDVPVRSLPHWETAYPRTSKLFEDPVEGLATIEALYVAYRLLDREADWLLEDYAWKDEFLRLNADKWVDQSPADP